MFKSSVLHWLLFVPALCIASPTWAVVDPTSPPKRFAVDLSLESKSGIEDLRPELQLQSILFSSQRQVVVINNRVLKVGQSIEGARVIAIDEQSVTLLLRDETFILTRPASSGAVKHFSSDNQGAQ